VLTARVSLPMFVESRVASGRPVSTDWAPGQLFGGRGNAPGTCTGAPVDSARCTVHRAVTAPWAMCHGAGPVHWQACYGLVQLLSSLDSSCGLSCVNKSSLLQVLPRCAAAVYGAAVSNLVDVQQR
jgi:hypothetical protein